MNRHRRPSPIPLTAIVTIVAVIFAPAACKSPQPFGDRDSVIVRADAELWQEIDSAFTSALEQTLFTTRAEPEFKLTFVAADDTLWRDLRNWRQVLVIGTGDDPIVQKLVASAKRTEVEPPILFQVDDVWARGQTVTALVLPGDRSATAALARLPDLYTLLHEDYREWIRQRMYASGVNDSLGDVLSAYGFSLELPRVYQHARQDSVFRFRNVHPDPGSLLRSVLVSWRTGTERVDSAGLYRWRDSIASIYYDPAQTVEPEGLRFNSAPTGAPRAVELRGVWQDTGTYPAAGPFILRALACPEQDRTYYMDAWVYAPGKDKYQYVVQLEIILNSFTCAEEEPVRITGERPTARSSVSTA